MMLFLDIYEKVGNWVYLRICTFVFVGGVGDAAPGGDGRHLTHKLEVFAN
jgi:hypothetical protein